MYALRKITYKQSKVETMVASTIPSGKAEKDGIAHDDGNNREEHNRDKNERETNETSSKVRFRKIALTQLIIKMILIPEKKMMTMLITLPQI